ncbi:MAG: hypothetical protein M3Q75_15170 [Gemmatimonadota bacterium]|nr:hypothetical protein [Gemmatimonadota bacterium]
MSIESKWGADDEHRHHQTKGEARMDFEHFVVLVARMRDLQRNYFKTRNPALLTESKKLEREVDRAVKEMTNDQPTLFGRDA